jgi:hypothetical protein
MPARRAVRTRWWLVSWLMRAGFRTTGAFGQSERRRRRVHVPVRWQVTRASRAARARVDSICGGRRSGSEVVARDPNGLKRLGAEDAA